MNAGPMIDLHALTIWGPKDGFSFALYSIAFVKGLAESTYQARDSRNANFDVWPEFYHTEGIEHQASSPPIEMFRPYLCAWTVVEGMTGVRYIDLLFEYEQDMYGD